MKYLNALNKINGIGPQKFKLLLDYFENGENVWQANLDELLQAGISENLATKIIQERQRINPDEEWQKLANEQINIISLTDDNYPKYLKEIPSAPYLLYVKGNPDVLRTPMLAMVGSRKFTTYGRQVALSLSRELANAGFTIVSGMALGIDTFAHQGALDAQAKTVAVLGSGLDDKNIGPRQNFQLSRRIMQSGALISDYSPETPASATTFPARNRLMAGMSLGTIVVEAEEKSGTLITAKMALDFSREIFAVPGSIFSASSIGANGLIRSGAKLVTGARDILEELNISVRTGEDKPSATFSPETAEEERLMEIISGEPLHINKIIKLSNLEAKIALSTLAILEMKQAIKNIGGQNYIKTKI